ncbi:MAG: hypothetical protein CMA02_03215 [Euryarchaeota archaeon]|nr:hypothetical protein [Euryarchaeota archaeon]
MGGSFDTTSCRDQDLGKFEIRDRDGLARIGRIFTKHGNLQTPMLLPVVNPNIRTIEPREMWEDFGVQGLITNSYVIWKHDKLKEFALKQGVHELLDFPGVIVTDSGTFQSYVYGDVEVGVEQIVEFQRDIGVDIGTMLDVFGRPDQPEDEIQNAVDETVSRALSSLDVAGEDLLLNGPIQGGLFSNLRSESAKKMGAVEGPHRGFSVHPIGGIVPLMEQHRYLDLVKIILATQKTIPVERPIHLFGCGHPMLFPMCIALGADLFDSAAYALFARDGRLLTPDGTVRIAELEEWPIASRTLYGITPEEVRKMDKKEMTDLLARFNLEITQAELARCREAIRTGKIWALVEQRSHSSPELREAFLYIKEVLQDSKNIVGQKIIEASQPVRSGSEKWSESAASRPHLLHARHLIDERWSPPPFDWTGNPMKNPQILLISSGRPPWRDSVRGDVIRALRSEPQSIPMIRTPVGFLPFDLEDWAPLCHIQATASTWDSQSSNSDLMSGASIKILEVMESSSDDQDNEIRSWLERSQISAKCSVFLGIERNKAWDWLEGMTVQRSSTGRINNVFNSEGEHILSPRLNDGGLSLTSLGATSLHHLDANLPEVVSVDDAVPFVRTGRNVIHGFIEETRNGVRPGLPALIVDSSGALIAHGIPTSTPQEMKRFRKGVAIRVRGGIKMEDSE